MERQGKVEVLEFGSQAARRKWRQGQYSGHSLSAPWFSLSAGPAGGCKTHGHKEHAVLPTALLILQ